LIAGGNSHRLLDNEQDSSRMSASSNCRSSRTRPSDGPFRDRACPESAAEWERVKVLPVAEAIGIYANKLDDLRSNNRRRYHYQGSALKLTTITAVPSARLKKSSKFSRRAPARFPVRNRPALRAAPATGADQREPGSSAPTRKTRSSTTSISRSAHVLLSEIIKLTALIKQLEESGSDEKLIGPLRKELQDVNFEVDKLSFKIKETGSFSDQLGVSLHEWVNGFGTAAQQVAGLIEGSINAALQGTNQLLLDAAFTPAIGAKP
jgi:hypothetical protein